MVLYRQKIRKGDRKMTITEMIKKFGITLTMQNGEEALRIPSYKKPTAKQLSEIKAAKPEIIAELKRQEAEEKAEREAKEKATVTFLVVGWESHEVSIDTRYDVDEQLRNIADYYSNDMTYDTVKKAYERAIEKETEKIEKKAKVEREKEAVFAKAKTTGEKQVLRKYMDECDGTACECSYDSITIYAMPDGSITEKRVHTH